MQRLFLSRNTETQMAAASYCKARPATKAARDAMISADSSTDDCCTPVDRPLLPKPSGRKRVRPPPEKEAVTVCCFPAVSCSMQFSCTLRPPKPPTDTYEFWWREEALTRSQFAAGRHRGPVDQPPPHPAARSDGRRARALLSHLQACPRAMQQARTGGAPAGHHRRPAGELRYADHHRRHIHQHPGREYFRL
jgi:hypothetical protein